MCTRDAGPEQSLVLFHMCWPFGNGFSSMQKICNLDVWPIYNYKIEHLPITSALGTFCASQHITCVCFSCSSTCRVFIFLIFMHLYTINMCFHPSAECLWNEIKYQKFKVLGTKGLFWIFSSLNYWENIKILNPKLIFSVFFHQTYVWVLQRNVSGRHFLYEP